MILAMSITVNYHAKSYGINVVGIMQKKKKAYKKVGSYITWIFVKEKGGFIGDISGKIFHPGTFVLF